ncbi:unnamed protein product, partial [Mesorhabditis belari]|uniref:G-protein coupled receptors family 1 profile domain-containing protein n=1 Tax=Mesorhabditis belari TaxID=2138241 RepID=A0AAF3F4Q1_9BILA
MHHPTIITNLIFFSTAPLLFNLISIPCILTKSLTASSLPILVLLLVDCALSALLTVPLYGFLTESGVYDETTCDLYGALDMCLSLWQVSIVTLISFDRYIATLQPKWGSFRNIQTYTRCLFVEFFICLSWSALPILGFGRYSSFFNGHICSLDFTLGESGGAKRTGNTSIDEYHDSQATRYMSLLTATFILFFLIPVCVASSLYYSVADHVDRSTSAEAREDPNAKTTLYTWAPNGHVTKVGLGCVIISTVPYLAYAFVCLDPSSFSSRGMAFFLTPLMVSRISTLLIPLFYVWVNPELFDIETKVLKRLRRRPPPPKSYQTINLIADLPCQTLPILTPTVPRRQLPQIPAHLISPSRTPRNTLHVPGEQRPLLA